MTNPMRHDEVRELLAAQAIDLLAPDERSSVLQHIATCPECSEELEAFRATAAALALAAPDRAFDARRCNGVRSRLIARTAADREARARLAAGQLPDREPRSLRLGAAADAEPRPDRWRVSFMLLAASLAALLVIGGGLLLQSRRQLAAERERNERQERLVAGLTGPNVRIVELAATPQGRGRARMFWNQATNGWTLIADDLAPPPAGRTYQLWLITQGDRKIGAGVFAPSPSGSAIVTATYALAPDSLGAVAVTEEPAGGVPSPTGDVVLLGRTE